MLQLSSVWQGLWMNSSTLITMTIGSGSISRNYPTMSYSFVIHCTSVMVPNKRSLHKASRSGIQLDTCSFSIHCVQILKLPEICYNSVS